MDSFSVAHWERTAGAQPQLPLQMRDAGLLQFETCRRILWISFSSDNPFHGFADSGLNVEVFTESEAYQFLLEVISGLHSPVLGETEVLGQFREFARMQAESNSPDSRRFRPWSMLLLEDCKAIRQEFLRGLGGDSYGRILRKWTKDRVEVGILGTGQLATELRPWVPAETKFFSRNPERALLRLPTWPIQGLDGISSLTPYSALVIASPIDCASLHELEETYARLKLHWIDLRGERRSFQAQQDLSEVFAEQRESSIRLDQLRDRGLSRELSRRAVKRWNHIIHRPYGWEDLTS